LPDNVTVIKGVIQLLGSLLGDETATAASFHAQCDNGHLIWALFGYGVAVIISTGGIIGEKLKVSTDLLNIWTFLS
jgi:hypothetical protein